jgi:hypothetical protein
MNMRLNAKILLIAAGVYLAFWGATRLSATWILERQLLSEARVDWERHRGDPRRKEAGSMAFESGPQIEVELLSCPAPLVFKAKCGRIIGPLNGYGTVGRYFLTPWRAYLISEVHTWVS